MPKQYADFAEWAEEKMELEREAAEKKAEEEEAKAAVAAEAQRKANAAFGRWTIDKRVHDDALGLLFCPAHGPGALSAMGGSDDDWHNVLMAVAYTQTYLTDQHSQYNVEVSENKKRSLEYVFVQYSKKNHGFDKITISNAYASKFTPKGKEGLEAAEEEGKYCLSVSYTPPHYDLSKPANPDDKLKNKIFVKAVLAKFKSALELTAKALDEEAGPMSTHGPKRIALSYARGIRTLHKYADEIVAAAAAKAVADENSRVAQGREQHLKWMAAKDKVAIRIPDASEFVEVPSAPKSHFATDGVPNMITTSVSGGKSFRHAPPGHKPQLRSAVELLEGMGSRILRHAHALPNGDLQNSRRFLLSKGIIYPENFASEEDGLLTEEGREAYERAVMERDTKAASEKAVKAEAAERAFVDWVSAKEGSILARECMALMHVTLSHEPTEKEVEAAAAAAAAAASGWGVDTSRPHEPPPVVKPSEAPRRLPSEDEKALWHAVGYACRAINRALLEDWVVWSEALFTPVECARAWKRFTPPPGSEPTPKKPAPLSSTHPVVSKGDADFENWGSPARLAALRMLHSLVAKHKELALFRLKASREVPPGLPVLKRSHTEEALPRFIHGSEGAIVRLQGDLGIHDGNGCIPLGGTSVGSELVLQWYVGEEPPEGVVAEAARHLHAPPGNKPGKHNEEATVPEPMEDLLARMAHDALLRNTTQPKYVVVLESVGVSGAARSLAGDWQRVFVDPPEPLPVLTSAPGSLYVPLSPSAQNLLLPPPKAGEEWPGEAINTLGSPFARTARDLRGGVRLVGLKPNTCYAFRARAYSRAGAGPYVFGAFTTAPSPPPAPLPALPSYVPRGILASEGAADLVAANAPFQPDGVTIIWDKGVDFRVGFLRLLRIFATVAKRVGRKGVPAWRGGAAGGGGKGRRGPSGGTLTHPVEDEDGILDYGDEGVGEGYGEDTPRRGGGGSGGGGNGGLLGGDSGGGLFDASVQVERTLILDAITMEAGLANWLGACVAVVDYWPIREGEPGGGKPLYMAVEESERAGAGVTSLRKVSPRLLSAIATPVSVLEVMIKFDHREVYSWSDVCALFSPDSDERTPSDILLAGLQPLPPPVYDSTLPPPPGDALELAPSTATALMAITGRGGSSSGGGSRPGSARSHSRGPVATESAAIVESHGGKFFNIAGGARSDLSVRNSALRTSQTKLTHTYLHTLDAKMAVIAAGGGGPTPLPSASASSSSSRPGSASASSRGARPSSAASAYSVGALGASAVLPGGMAVTGGGGMDMSGGGGGGNTLRSRPGTAGSSSSSSSVTTTSIIVHPKGSARPIPDVSMRYSLQECDSDGPLGQEWREVYLGVRSLRVMDKLFACTSYAFKVQAINQDGVGSLFGPQCTITTALPSPPNLRFVGAIGATSVTLAWDAVSSANPLTTARALGKPAGPAAAAASEGGEEEEKGEEEGTDFDAILEALVKKSKSKGGEGGVVESGDGEGVTLMSAASAVPVREGDLGWGCDLTRVWRRYDRENSGTIPRAALRGLLCDLGVYHESARLVFGSGDANEGASSSGEGAAQVGPLEWRLAAALRALDPMDKGKIRKQDFSDWWNAIDAALEKAANVNSAPGTPARTPSRGNSAASIRKSGGGDGGGGGQFPSLAKELGIAADEEDLQAAVVYVLEARRFVPSEEVTAAAAAVVDVTSRGGNTSNTSSSSSRPSTSSSSALRPTSARSTLHAPISLAITAPTLKEAAEEAAALSQGSYTPWSVVFMGSTPRYKLTSLLPNALYQFRVTAMGRHAFSNPTRSLTATLPPLAPFTPIMVRVGPRFATLRWYPQAMGADKFEVQVKMVEALAPPGYPQAGRRENDGGIVCARNFSEGEMRALVTSGERRDPLAPEGGGRGEGRGLWAEDADLGGEMGRARSEAWATMYTGMSTFTTLTGLLANTVYRVRIVAYSSAGTPSRPSHELQLVTIDNSAYAPVTIASAVRDFVLVCKAVVEEEETPALPPASPAAAAASPAPGSTLQRTTTPAIPTNPTLAKIHHAGCSNLQDIVVGDTIVWTEDVWINGKAPVDKFHPAPPKEVPYGPDAVFLTSRTIAAQVIGDTASRLGQGTGNSANVGGEQGPVPVGAMAKALTLVGKFPVSPRTTRVARDGGEEFSSTTGGGGGAVPGGAGTLEEAVRARTLTLQVEWCTLGLESKGTVIPKVLRASHGAHTLAAAHPELYTKTMGCNMARKAKDLAKLDVFRMRWVDEEGRWGLAEELGASYDR